MKGVAVQLLFKIFTILKNIFLRYKLKSQASVPNINVHFCLNIPTVQS